MSQIDDGSADSLTRVTSLVREGDNAFLLRVPAGWNQGRGAFGGLVLGALARAALACEPDAERALRALTGQIAGPVLQGDARVRAVVLRRGSAVSTIRASLEQNGEVLAEATAVLGRARALSGGDRAWSPPAPPAIAAGWRDVPVMPHAAGFAPDFTRHVAYRLTGPAPFAGATEPVVEGWVGMRRALDALDAPELIAFADAYYPAAFTVEPAPRPSATVAFTIELFSPRATLDPAEPLFHRARAIAAQAGYIVEMRELWTPRGDLVALNQQTFVLIR